MLSGGAEQEIKGQSCLNSSSDYYGVLANWEFHSFELYVP